MLPGFTLTVAMSELATQNYLAGTGRLTGAVILLFLMGAGLAIGTALSQAVWPLAAPGSVVPLPAWVIWPAVAILGVTQQRIRKMLQDKVIKGRKVGRDWMIEKRGIIERKKKRA